TARPTATDEIVMINGAAWGAINSDTQQRLHVMQSTDGACTRMAMHSASICKGFFMFDTPTNTVTGWTNPSITVALGLNSSSTVVSQSYLYDSVVAKGRGASTMSIYFTAEARTTVPLFNVFTTANDLSS